MADSDYFLELVENYPSRSRLTVAWDGRVSVKIHASDMHMKDRLIAFAMRIAESNDFLASARGRISVDKYQTIHVQMCEGTKNIRKTSYSDVLPEVAAERAARKNTPRPTHVTQADGNIFADLGFPEPEASELLADANARLEERLQNCKVSPVSSRMCEYGTKGCESKHEGNNVGVKDDEEN